MGLHIAYYYFKKQTNKQNNMLVSYLYCKGKESVEGDVPAALSLSVLLWPP
jgi:hypothetical protein